MTMWFDVLPVHPPPLPLESFTGYLGRLAQLNQLNTKSALGALTHPHKTWKGTWSDYPLQDFGNLCVATQCSERQLQATTLYHLVRKFGRGLAGHHCSRFLLTSLSSHLRYCPHCLDEKGYYSLLWRFRDLQGCLEHGCHLLDCCGQCGAAIPLISMPLRLGICPTCNHDLRHDQAMSLTKLEIMMIARRTQDLTYLLMPQEWEASGTFTQVVGQYLIQLRRGLGWSAYDMAEKLGISRGVLRGVEGFKAYGHGSTFQHVLQFMDLVDASFEDVVTITRDPQACQMLKVRQLVQAVQRVIADFEAKQQVVTQADICRALGTISQSLQQYPEIKAILQAVTASRKAQYNRIMLTKVRTAILQLLAQGHEPTIRNICPLIQRSETALRRTPGAYALIQFYNPSLGFTGEARLMIRIQQAIEILRDDIEPLTQTNISRQMGKSLPYLRRFPKVCSTLDAYPRR